MILCYCYSLEFSCIRGHSSSFPFHALLPPITLKSPEHEYIDDAVISVDVGFMSGDECVECRITRLQCVCCHPKVSEVTKSLLNSIVNFIKNRRKNPNLRISVVSRWTWGGISKDEVANVQELSSKNPNVASLRCFYHIISLMETHCHIQLQFNV